MGLGNGPLSVPAASGGYGWTEAAVQPWVYVVPLVNSAGESAVIDSVGLVPASGFPGVRVRSIRVGRDAGYRCTDLGAVSSLAGCVDGGLAPAAGFAVPAAANNMAGIAHGPALVIELAGPAASQCTVLAQIVLHFHVGIRHYAASYPQGTVSVCGNRAHRPQN